MKIKKLLFLLPTICLLPFIFFYKADVTEEPESSQSQSIEEDSCEMPNNLPEGDTFSIVAYDPITGEIGSAGTSCVGRTIDFLGDLIIDGNGKILGGINTQAAYLSGNQNRARQRMLAGDSPQDIVNYMAANDVERNPGDRQYGVVGFDNAGNLTTAAYTGNTTGNYHGHITGVNYAIQGNILVNGDVLADMETAFIAEQGSLADKLMAALQGAKRVGGDIRCQGSGNSGSASFIKVLKPGDTAPYINITLGPVSSGIEPIDELQCQYDALITPSTCNNVITAFPYVMNFEDRSWAKPANNCDSNTASWIRTEFGTASANTGPSAANEGSLYAFVESSNLGQGFDNTAIMESPCFDFPENHSVTVQFDYHMSGSSMGSLSLEVFNDNQWQSVWTQSGDQGTNWINDETVDASAFSGKTVAFRFVGTTGNSFTSDMAVDDISIRTTDLSQTFTFNNGLWSPNNPADIVNPSDGFDTVSILSGDANITAQTRAGHLNISSGASLVLNGNTLSVAHSIQNLGTLDGSQGSLDFIGEGLQEVSGNPIIIQNIEFNQAGTVSLETKLQIQGTMQLNSGTLQTNDNLVFTDDYDSVTDTHTTGVLDTYNGGLIVGDVQVERYIPARRAFRFIASSVSTGSATIRENWQENGNLTPNLGTHITGKDGNINGFDDTATNNPSLFQLDVASQSYKAVSNTNATVLNAGNAFLMLFRGDRTVDLSTNTPTPTPTRLRTTGVLHIGNFEVSNISAVANGSTLIGNPYQAPVDMGKVLSNSTNINARYYHVWDPFISTRGAFVTVDTQTNTNSLTSGGVSLSPANKFLQPHQSAFINTIANGSSSLTFLESHKDINGNGVGVFRPSEEDMTINLLLKNTDDIVLDGTKLVFSQQDNSELTLDDAVKIDNIDAGIASLSQDKDLSIQRRALPKETEVIGLRHKNLANKAYRMSVETNGMLDGFNIYVEDTYLNKRILLSKDTETVINFDINSIDEQSSNPKRFQLIVEPKTLEVDSVDWNKNPITWVYNKSNNTLVFNYPDSLRFESITLYDIKGTVVNRGKSGQDNESYTIDVSHLTSGVCLAEIKLTGTNAPQYVKVVF